MSFCGPPAPVVCVCVGGGGGGGGGGSGVYKYGVCTLYLDKKKLPTNNNLVERYIHRVCWK